MTAELPGWRPVYSGKVRDLYLPEDGTDDRMLVVASDRVSAFDHVLEPGIPEKGELLTRLSMWWFDQLAGADGGVSIPNHLAQPADPFADEVPEPVRGRAMLVHRLDMLPVECVVRGYLTGSGWAEYTAEGTVCGIPLPPGLSNGDRLPEPLFTPAYKAPLGEHDENISFARTIDLVGADTAHRLRDLSLEIYRRAAATAAQRGLILADTKFEFGLLGDQIVLGDEVLTSDSSRYWDAEAWRTGTSPAERMASFDKQIVRDWLAAHWSGAPGHAGPPSDEDVAPPRLPEHIVAGTAAKYRELIARLTAD